MRKMIACGFICALMVTGCTSATPTKLDPSAPASLPAATAPKAPETFKIGDRVKVGDQVLTVSGVRLLPPGQFLKPKDGHVWMALDCVIENAGSQATVVSSLMEFKATDGDGYQYNPTFAEGNKGDLNGNVAVGAKIRGEVVFEIANNAKDVRLQFMSGLTGNPAVVILGNMVDKPKQ